MGLDSPDDASLSVMINRYVPFGAEKELRIVRRRGAIASIALGSEASEKSRENPAMGSSSPALVTTHSTWVTACCPRSSTMVWVCGALRATKAATRATPAPRMTR